MSGLSLVDEIWTGAGWRGVRPLPLARSANTAVWLPAGPGGTADRKVLSPFLTHAAELKSKVAVAANQNVFPSGFFLLLWELHGHGQVHGPPDHSQVGRRLAAVGSSTWWSSRSSRPSAAGAGWLVSLLVSS